MINSNHLSDAQEPSWLTVMRDTAHHQFQHQGYPTAKHEDWKYTRLNSLVQQEFALPKTAASYKLKPMLQSTSAYHIVMSNGQVQASNFPPEATLCSLQEAVQLHSELVQTHLTKIAANEKHGLHALNTANMYNGYFLYLPKGVKLSKPIYVWFFTEQQAQPTVFHLRNLIIAEEHSSATVIEHYSAASDHTYWTNVVSEVKLAAHAELTHVKLQQEATSAYHIGTLSVMQAEHSALSSHSYALGGRLVRSDTDVVQQGEFANSTLYGLYLAYDKQHIDHHTSIAHTKPHGTSLELYKGIVAEQGRAVFNGKVVVYEDAQKIAASQTNNNLLLSEQAEIDTKPELEIYADDVRCAHGATVGQLAQEQLFYLRARGLSEQAARSLLLQAFVNEVIVELKVPEFDSLLHAAIQHKLGQEALEELL